ncbi:AsmA-like C-terminal region-containing protein [Larkinella rosea]|uniref:AsmA family protein n=1 Tax=Larkinella rosea TaxID=2025312 RepID=A0A3P1BCJ6_9BACT|nr:AsmA-like C-terminal region-containing protein [Larkinella rosea]RRA98754.1 AsmA family protein [Larkinella rosea]
MKKTGIITASVLGVLLLTAWIVPMFFRDKIVTRLQQELNNRLNAHVSFRPEKVSLSLLRHFPNLTLQTDSLSIVGQSPFRGDTLLSVRAFEMSVNLLSAVSGDKLKLNGVYLDQPRILVKLLRDGRANYDIYKAAESDGPEKADTSQTAFTLDIDEWEIKNGLIRYEDQSLPLTVRLETVNHSGSGSLSAEIADLALNTKAERITVSYDGMEYLSDKKLDSDMKLRADFEKAVYTFAENRIRLNDLPIELNGSISTGAMPTDTSMRFDLTYRSPESDFKNLLSLVPGIYSERFQGIDADGTVRFDGKVKGSYNGKQIPAFLLNLAVNDGRFKYPNLASAVEHIGLDLTVSNSTDQLTNTVINLKKLAADLGHNPVRGRVLLKGLTRSVVDADVTAKLNLEELTQLFPIDSLTLRGLADLNVKAKGVYDKTANRFPVVDALMRLQNGFVKSMKVPEPINGINAVASLTNRTGNLTDTRVDIANLQLKLAGDPFQAKGWVQNFDDYSYDITAKGRLDLTNLTRIFPVEGTKLAGLIDANIETKGQLSDAKAKRYDRLPTSGTMAITKLSYKGESLPQGLTLNTARLHLSPGKLTVEQANGLLGTSQFTADGFLSNYMPFLLDDNQPLEGTLNVRANRLNINEWITDDSQPQAKTAQPSVIELPKNIRFTMNANVDQAVYDKMPLNNIKGQLELADGALQMKKVTFNSLGGQFVTNGTYDPTNLAKPRFAFDIDIANAEVSQAYKHLTLAKVIFPLAQYVIGRFSSKFAVDGRLEPDMMPDLNSLTGNGLVEIVQATLKNNPVLERLFEKTKLTDLRNPNFKDLLMKVEVKNGFVSIRPFDVKVKDNIVTVSGSNSLEGDLKYTLKLDVPTGKAGVQFANAFSSLTGQPLGNVDRAKVDFALGGNYKKPQFKFLGGQTVNEVKDAVVKRAKNDLKEQGLKWLQKLAKTPKDST